MTGFNYDSYCGLYCGACSILKAYQTGIKDKFASFWAEEAKMELTCHGCKSDTLFVNCSNCKIRACAIDKGVERCLVCQDFPCGQFDVAEFKNVLDSLPHLKTIQNNLEAIKEKGADGWLAQQDKRWKCPDCQTDFSWYADNCSKCGRDLTKLKGFSNFDKKFFEYLLPKKDSSD
jgi:hypothetical protein